MPLGGASSSVLLDYVQGREKLSPATNVVWVSEHG